MERRLRIRWRSTSIPTTRTRSTAAIIAPARSISSACRRRPSRARSRSMRWSPIRSAWAASRSTSAGRSAPREMRRRPNGSRSEEHTSELQSLRRNSYAVLCLKKKNKKKQRKKRTDNKKKKINKYKKESDEQKQTQIVTVLYRTDEHNT